MPTLEVKCSVSNCFFHAKGNICGAEQIEIDMNDYQAKNKDRTEFASDFNLRAPAEKQRIQQILAARRLFPKRINVIN